MKQILFLISFLLIFQVSFSQNLNKGEILQKEYFEVIPYEDLGGLPFVNIQINGKSHRFLFDTGAVFALNQELMDELNVTKTSKVLTFDSSGKSDSIVAFVTNEIRLGNLVFQNTAGIHLPESALTQCLEYSGIIGSNMLRNSVVQFSSIEKTITITNDAKKLNLNTKKNFSSKLKLSKHQSDPFLWVDLKNGKKKGKLELHFDSGMNGLFDFSLRHYDVLKKYQVYETIVDAEGVISMGYWGNANPSNHHLVLFPELKINKNALLKNVQAKTTSAKNSRIGAEIFKYGIVTIDYTNKKFYFEPLSKEQDAGESVSPFSGIILGDKFVVGMIWEKELEKQLSLGDEIISVNNVIYNSQNFCDFFIDSIHLKTLEEYPIQIKNKEGEIKEILIRKKQITELIKK